MCSQSSDTAPRRSTAGFRRRPSALWLLGNLNGVGTRRRIRCPGGRRRGRAASRRPAARARADAGAARLSRSDPRRLRAAQSRSPCPTQGVWDGCQRPDWLPLRAPRSCGSRSRSTDIRTSCTAAAAPTRWTCCTREATATAYPWGRRGSRDDRSADGSPRCHVGDARLGGNPRRDVLDALRTCGSSVCAQGRVLIVDGCSDKFGVFDREADWAAPPTPSAPSPTSAAARCSAPTRRPDRALPEGAGGELIRAVRPRLHARGLRPRSGGFRAVRRTRVAPRSARPGRLVPVRRPALREGGRAATQAWQAFAQTAYSLPPARTATRRTACSAPGRTCPRSRRPRRSGHAVRRRGVPAGRSHASAGRSLAARCGRLSLRRRRFHEAGPGEPRALLLPEIRRRTPDPTSRVGDRTRRWLEAMTLLDTLLATDERFLLGTWLRSGGYDARSLITTWGGRGPAGLLRNYGGRSCRVWSRTSTSRAGASISRRWSRSSPARRRSGCRPTGSRSTTPGRGARKAYPVAAERRSVRRRKRRRASLSAP